MTTDEKPKYHSNSEMRRMEAQGPKLTKWEVGNELVRVADSLSYAITELKDFPEVQEAIRGLRRQLVRLYKANGFVEEMGFGI